MPEEFEDQEKYQSHLAEADIAGRRNLIGAGAVALFALMIGGIFMNLKKPVNSTYFYLGIVSGYAALLMANLALGGKRNTGKRDAWIAAAVAAAFFIVWLATRSGVHSAVHTLQR